MMDALALAARAGLPDNLQLLLGAYPRRIWGDHPNFGPMSRFYLDRHAMFREALGVLNRQTEEALDKRLDPGAYGRNFARIGNFFLGELTAHHHIEDASFFPALVALEPRLAHGFDMLETDHLAIHAALERFQADGGALLRALAEGGAEDALGRMQGVLAGMETLLDRHLTDEEELVVPIILDKGEAALNY
jgi:hemerythrin-like domain-containing protein